MSIESRIGQAEAHARNLPPAPPPAYAPSAWLAHFEGLAGTRDWSTEPDFPAALAELRSAVATAVGADVPAPLDAMPADVKGCLRWLDAMSDRAGRGESPSLTLAEWHELRAWYDANKDRFPTDPKVPNRYLFNDFDLFPDQIEAGLREGPRTGWGEQQSAVVRNIRRQLGDLPATEVTSTEEMLG